MKPPPFSDEEIERYSRQILLREVGGRGQRRLLAAAPVLFCTDAVGELAASYLLRAGVLRLGVFTDAPQLGALAERLRDEGPPPARPRVAPLASAPPRLRERVAEAPGFTLVLLAPDAPGDPAAADGDDGGGDGDGDGDGAIVGDLFFARCTGDRAIVGGGADGLRAACRELGAGPAAPGAGDAAALTGSALALLVVQRLLGLPTPRRLRIDTGQPAAPFAVEPAQGGQTAT
ncbi:MAG: hypothetical protein U1A78_06845 [Polyangia bacterium]